jgi:quinoprotein glucose dehydrogenase
VTGIQLRGDPSRIGWALSVIAIATTPGFSGHVHGATPDNPEAWAVYNGHASNDHYSSLSQISTANVTRLREVWRATWEEPGDSETNPLIVGHSLFGYTPSLSVVALDATNGRQLWRFDPGLHGEIFPGKQFTGAARGLVYWSEGTRRRLVVGVMNYLFTLDADSGKPVMSFGEDGAIDLRKDLRGDPEQHYLSMTSPAIRYRDLLIVGFGTRETRPAPPGDIRAYDLRSGKLRWAFHTIPREHEAGASTWPKDAWRSAGAANNWAGMALDEARGIVYVPTGSAVSDFYGADRIGDDLYANTLLALDASSGRLLWHFQGVHHDIWDRDFASPPTLLTVNQRGKAIDAVAQPTKQGFLYLFDRVTGRPLFPVQERKFPGSTVPGELASHSQPIAESPAPFARQFLDESLLTDRTPEAHEWALKEFRTYLGGGLFVPLSVAKPTIVFPGFDGGAEWGGAAVDPKSGVLYLNANDIAWTGKLVKTIAGGGLGSALYLQECSVCHGPDRKGSPPAFPALDDVVQRLGEEQVSVTIHNGRGRMPPFVHIQNLAQAALIEYLRTGQDAARSTPPEVVAGADSHPARGMSAPMFSEGEPAPYRFAGYIKFLDPEGYPAVKPPWGTLNAIDLNTGSYSLAGALGRVSGVGGEGHEGYRFGELWRPYCYRRRPGIHRCHGA